MRYPSYLIHFNPNHDPKTGQFAPGDRLIKKGTNIYRISRNPSDPTYDNKKYVSLTEQDHSKWQKYIGDAYKERGEQTYNIMYTPVKDLRIAPYTIIVDEFIKNNNLDSESINKILNDTYDASKRLNYDSDNLDDMLSLNFAMQTETGKKFINDLIDLGYDGIEDIHGRNVADDPIILFDPDNNIRKTTITSYN